MLADRKKRILTAIVESFLSTGEPIGSKTLMSLEGLNCSSATIRNEMADLTAGGYLTQPHTSAGRIPTVKGCRYYIDNLMPDVPINPRLRDYIDARLAKVGDTPEKILREAAAVLSEISGMAAVTTTPPGEDARIHRIRIVGIGRHTAMAVVVTTAGEVKSSLFRTSFVVTEEVTRMLDLTLNRALGGVPLRELTKGFMQSLAASFKEMALLMPEVLIVIMDIAASAQNTELCVSGTAKLLFMPELDPVLARGAISFLTDTEKVARLLNRTKEKRIYMGSESGYPELSGVSAITLRYTIGGTPAGSIALFTPIRADYPALIALIKYTAEIVSGLIDELVDI